MSMDSKWLLDLVERHGRWILEELEYFHNAIRDDRVDEVLERAARLFSFAVEHHETRLELFVRHWSLQMRVGVRQEGVSALSEAVELAARASAVDAFDLPESICAAHDLCACYGNIDSVGYARERLAVIDEIVDRVSPASSCFSCVTRARCHILTDLDRTDEALEYLTRREQTVRAAGLSATKVIGRFTRARLLAAAERWQEVYAELRGTVAERTSRREESEFRRMYAEALFRLGRKDEAAFEFPGPEDVSPLDVSAWATLAAELAVAGVIVATEAVRAKVKSIAEQFERHGATRPAVDGWLAYAEICRDVDPPEYDLALAKSMELIGQLRAPRKPLETLRRIRLHRLLRLST